VHFFTAFEIFIAWVLLLTRVLVPVLVLARVLVPLALAFFFMLFTPFFIQGPLDFGCLFLGLLHVRCVLLVGLSLAYGEIVPALPLQGAKRQRNPRAVPAYGLLCYARNGRDGTISPHLQ